jgi:hypothetical protein
MFPNSLLISLKYLKQHRNSFVNRKSQKHFKIHDKSSPEKSIYQDNHQDASIQGKKIVFWSFSHENLLIL